MSLKPNEDMKTANMHIEKLIERKLQGQREEQLLKEVSYQQPFLAWLIAPLASVLFRPAPDPIIC